MIRIIKWYEHHYRSITILLAILLIAFAFITHRAIEERKNSENAHAKMNYDNELIKFLIREGCGGGITHE